MTLVIYPDVNASISDYKGLAPNEMLVSSIFHTLQGEGPFAGHPATFVRLAGCNLGGKGVNGPGCQFCDTDFRLSNGKPMTFDEINKTVKGVRRQHEEVQLSYRDDLIVITGGEPLLQPNIEGLVRYLSEIGYLVQIESNGMIPRDIDTHENVTLVVSPKVPSNMQEYPPLPNKIFKRADCLKIVVTANPDDPHHYFPHYLEEFADTKRNIYVSPMAVYRNAPKKVELGAGHTDIITSAWNDETNDRNATAQNYTYAAELCIKYGLLLSIQQHLFAVVP